MSNTRPWRAKKRTSKPNSRQKRNGLFLDAHAICQQCHAARSVHAHHILPKGFPGRDHWLAMRALCEPCHIAVHAEIRIVFVFNGS